MTTKLALASLSVFTVVVLGIWSWWLDPDHSAGWGFVVFFLPALWGFLEMAQAEDPGREARPIIEFHRAVIAWTGLVLAIAVAVKLAVSTGLLGPEWELTARRVRGVMYGVGLTIWGNYLPKLLSPWRLEDEPFDWQHVHRFVGWVATLCGIALIMVWLTLPPETARVGSMGITAVFVVLSVGRKFMSLATHTAPSAR